MANETFGKALFFNITRTRTNIIRSVYDFLLGAEVEFPVKKQNFSFRFFDFTKINK